jgi:hypothetical protein
MKRNYMTDENWVDQNHPFMGGNIIWLGNAANISQCALSVSLDDVSGFPR